MTSRRIALRASARRRLAHPAARLATVTICVVTLASVLVAAAASADVKVESEQDKAIYLIGISFARQLGPLYLTPEEMEIVAKGLVDAAHDRAMDLDPQVYGPKIQMLQETRAKQALGIETEKSNAYLAAQRKEKGAKQTDSGLIITQLKEGSGKQPTPDSKVRVHYTGTLRDGTVFDSSVQRGQPAEFPLSGVIPCWSEGVGMMKVGGKAKLVCPADIAYGDKGAPPAIPPGAALTFNVELLDIIE